MRWRIAIAVLLAAMPAAAQVVSASGTDAASGLAWTLISMSGKVVSGTTAELPPRLTAQCTRDDKAKLRFELLADVGSVPEVQFVAPFKATKDDLYPPRLPTAAVTMEFLGYTTVKPVKRQWVQVDGVPGEWKYATPGVYSSNMEEVMFYLQYLKALPTLRLTLPDGMGKPAVVEFDTAAWKQKVKAEPMCWASAL